MLVEKCWKSVEKMLKKCLTFLRRVRLWLIFREIGRGLIGIVIDFVQSIPPALQRLAESHLPDAVGHPLFLRQNDMADTGGRKNGSEN